MGVPIELYEQPHARQGPRADHDTTTPQAQAALLADARSGRYLFWWLGFPCTGFCSWNKVNGATRTKARPDGDPGGARGERREAGPGEDRSAPQRARGRTVDHRHIAMK